MPVTIRDIDIMEKNKALRRTFEAKKQPKGSVQRKKLNKSALTSEYMPSERYIVYYGGQPFSRSFITKKEAEKWLAEEKR